MKIKELLGMNIDVDVCDNVCEELSIAFIGPVYLTEAGKQKFADVLEFDVHFGEDEESDIVTVDVDDKDEAVFERKLASAKKLFDSAAGWCTMDEWNEWFIDA